NAWRRVERVREVYGHGLTGRRVGRLKGNNEGHEHPTSRHLVGESVYRHLNSDEWEGIRSRAILEREGRAGVDGDQEVGDGTESEGLILRCVLLDLHRLLVVDPREMNQDGRLRCL